MELQVTLKPEEVNKIDQFLTVGSANSRVEVLHQAIELLPVPQNDDVWQQWNKDHEKTWAAIESDGFGC